MSHANAILYFVSQAYRQVQLSVAKGTALYPYSEFSRQFYDLFDASGDEDYTRNLAIILVEEAGRLHQSTDYLHQEMAFEAQAIATGNRAKAIDELYQDSDLQERRRNRLN